MLLTVSADYQVINKDGSITKKYAGDPDYIFAVDSDYEEDEESCEKEEGIGSTHNVLVTPTVSTDYKVVLQDGTLIRKLSGPPDYEFKSDRVDYEEGSYKYPKRELTPLNVGYNIATRSGKVTRVKPGAPASKKPKEPEISEEKMQKILEEVTDTRPLGTTPRLHIDYKVLGKDGDVLSVPQKIHHFTRMEFSDDED